jgi:hypothetical protein
MEVEVVAHYAKEFLDAKQSKPAGWPVSGDPSGLL